MIKKIFVSLLIFFIVGSAKSQILVAILFGDKLNTGKLEFGLVVAPAFTNLTNTNSDYRSGLNLGLFFNIHPQKKFFVHLELTAKGSLGAKNLPPYTTGNDSLNIFFSEGSVERIIKSFNLTLMGRYAFSSRFFADAGIQPDLMFKPKDFFKSKVNDNELEYRIKLNDQITRLDFCVAGGLFYKFRPDRRSMGIGLRYVYGLTDINKVQPGTQANTAWLVTVTIPVGAPPKDKQEKK
jgi:hypothetical protein